MMTTAQLQTYADLARMPDDRNRYELIEGTIVMSPAPTTKHQCVVGSAFAGLRDWVKPRRLGSVFGAPVDVHLTPTDVVEPDIVFIAVEHADRIRPDAIWGAPDLVVEVLSPPTRHRDLNEKRRLYETHGIGEYWLLDPEAETIDLLALVDGRYQSVAAVDHRLASTALPGFAIDTVEFFGELV